MSYFRDDDGEIIKLPFVVSEMMKQFDVVPIINASLVEHNWFRHSACWRRRRFEIEFELYIIKLYMRLDNIALELSSFETMTNKTFLYRARWIFTEANRFNQRRHFQT